MSGNGELTDDEVIDDFEDDLGFCADVKEFFDRFEVPHRGTPGWPEQDVLDFRLRHVSEEVAELLLAAGERDLPRFADALADLVYCAVGTARVCGVPLSSVWDEVHAANMRKVRCDGADDPRGKRGHAHDVVKPDGWRPPDVEGVLARFGWRRS